MTSISTVWHRGIGSDISPDMSIEEQLDIAGLNWEVATSPIRYGENYSNESDYQRAIYRTDNGKLLDTCGKNWKPFQNQQIVKTFHKFCEGTNLTIDHLGSLDDGRVIFASANLPTEINVRKVGDIVHGRILLLNYHKVGFGLNIKIQLERLICTNGMTQSVKLGNKIINHISAFNADRVESILEGAFKSFEEFGHNAEQLAATNIGTDEATLLLIKSFGNPKLAVDQQPAIVQTCLRLFDGQALGSDMLSAYHTAWGLLNSVTEYFNHRSQVRGGTATHLNSLLNGSKANSQNQFYEQLVSVYQCP